MQLPFGKDSQALLELLHEIEQGKTHFPILLPKEDEHFSLSQLLNSLFEKNQKIIDSMKMQNASLVQENTKLATHAQTLTQQKQQTSIEQQAITQELTKSKDQLAQISLLVANIHQGIIALDEHLQVVFFNKAAERITGFEESYALHRPIGEVITVFDKTELLTPNLYCSSFNKANVKVVGNGKSAYVNLSSSKVGEKKNILFILILQDVTAEQEVERLKLDFVSMAAHELRTPLTTIRGYVSFLQDSKVLAKLNSEETDYLKKVSISAIRLNELVENLLTISKIEQGKMIIDPHPADILPLITKIAEEFTIYAEYKKLKLEFIRPPQTQMVISFDQTRIEEVLINLISNAINYTKVGKITLAVEQKKDQIVISVADTGIGIPKNIQPQLFTKYFRVQGSTASTKGTGLGLYICKIITDAHHGKIWVESLPDKGSTFFFSLPLV